MVAGGESQRDSERDYEPQASTVSEYDFDGEDEDDPGQERPNNWHGSYQRDPRYASQGSNPSKAD